MANNNRMWSGNRSNQNWDDEDYYRDNNRSMGNLGERSNWDDTYGDVGYDSPNRRSGNYNTERASWGNHSDSQGAYDASRNSGRSYGQSSQYDNNRNNLGQSGYEDFRQGRRSNTNYGGRNHDHEYTSENWRQEEDDLYDIDYNEDIDDRGSDLGQRWGRYRGVSHDAEWQDENDTYRDNYDNNRNYDANRNYDRTSRDYYNSGRNTGFNNQTYGRVRNTNRSNQYNAGGFGLRNQNYNNNYGNSNQYGSREQRGNRSGHYNTGRNNVNANRQGRYNQGHSRNAFGSGANRNSNVSNRNNDRNFWDRTRDEMASWFNDDNVRRRRTNRDNNRL